MKVNINFGKIVTGRFVSRTGQIVKRHGLASRLTAFLLMSALLMPIIFLGSKQNVSAKTNLPMPQQTVPQTAPLQPFDFSSSNRISATALSSVTTVTAFLTNGYGFVINSFTTPRMAEGFAMAKPVSPVSAFISSVGKSFGSFFALFAATSTGKKSANAVPNAALGQPTGTVEFDFDNDNKADLARRRASNNSWDIKYSSNGTINTVTSSAGNIAPADYDGDGKTDVAVFNAGAWTIKRSSDGNTETFSGLGQAYDKPVPGDYDGDGKADAAVYRPTTGVWYVRQSNNGNAVATISFGASPDMAVPGDYDGDAKMDYAVFRPSTGAWHVLGSTAGYFSVQWGLGSDVPVPADYDGDGKTDFAVYRPTSATWYVYKSSTNNGEFLWKVWGNYGDQPAPADYDGDNKADFAVWRPTTGVWHIVKSADSAYDYQALGVLGDTAISSAYIKQIGSGVTGYEMPRKRLAPNNATGGANPYSGNFSWGTSLVGLPGRAGLDAGFGISYNSLIWTRLEGAVYFDVDSSNVSPGFRFGFPTIEPAFFDDFTDGFSYLMVTPSGARVRFDQTAVSDTYETVDSSYAQLKTIGAANPNDPVEDITITVTTTDGTVMSYKWKGGAFRCQEIIDRNGNKISINHDELGLLRSVTDTLGRVISVEYDNELFPTKIKQTWKNSNGSGANIEHTWATFTYTGINVNTNFNSLLVYGPSNGTLLKVLQNVTYTDGSSTYFDYNGYGQVWKVRNIAADSQAHTLNYVRTNLQSPSGTYTDSPRFTQTASWTESFNNNQETVVDYETLTGQSYNVGGIQGTGTLIKETMQNHPHGAVRKTYYGGDSGWMVGLPVVTEDWATESGTLTRKRWTWTNWTQDNTNLGYIKNPRVTQTKVGDEVSTLKTVYSYTQYGLVNQVELRDQSDITLKKSVTSYQLDAAYTSRRIIGLPLSQEIYGKETTGLKLVSKVEYGYDDDQFNDPNLPQNISPAQHDTAGYGTGFKIGRGNVTSVTRYDVDNSSTVTSSIKYNTAGAPVAQITPGSTVGSTRMIKIDYTDRFNDDPTNQLDRDTFAYPTTITDPAGKSSTVEYRFDTGANVRAKSPTPYGTGNNRGKETAREYDDLTGRLLKEKIENTGAYTRYSYQSNGTQLFVYTTVTAGLGEAAAETVFDGAGRVLKSRTEMPNSLGWSGTKTEYDKLGRVTQQTVPTEVDSNWNTASGKDDRGIVNNQPVFLWTKQEYDWKGRVTKEINTDSTFKTFSYQGCGCAGNQTITIKGEEVPRDDAPGNATRTQKIHQDILGRTWKAELMKWDGITPYLTTTTEFNGRDQTTSVSQTDHDNSLTQVTTVTYDGYGRLKTRKRPEQTNPTTYNYNQDDSISSVVDARGAETKYTYNDPRGLLTLIAYEPPSGVPDTADVSFEYDNAGNRKKMTEVGFGTVDYEYTELSQLRSETREFDDNLPDAPLPLTNGFKLEYDYTLSGGLKSYKDPYGEQIDLSYDKTGRLSAVTGSSFDDVTDYALNPQYRAFGALSHLEYGNGLQMNATFNNRLQTASFEIKHPTDSSKQVFSKEYQYYQDGGLKFIKENFQDLTIKRLDRSYTYDHVGRIKQAKSGTEASGQTQTNLLNLPYRQSYDYNAFGHMTERESTLWTEEDWNFNESFTNNKNAAWTYDADGNALSADSVNYEFDAANRMIKTWRSQKFEMTIGKDGGGRDIKRSERTWNTQTGNWNTWETHYFINSSVLGRTVSETTSTGKKKRSFVIAGGTTIARQVVADNNDESVSWEYSDASAQSIRLTDANGTFTNADSGSAELDALGNNVGLHGTLTDPRNSDAEYSPFNRAPISEEIMCNRGGIVGACSVVEMLMSGGAGVDATGTLASMGTALPFQFTHDNHLTGRNYRDRFYLAQYENSLSGMIDSGYLQEIAGNNSGGEEGCVGGVCGVVQVTWNPSIFVYHSEGASGSSKYSGQTLNTGPRAIYPSKERIEKCVKQYGAKDVSALDSKDRNALVRSATLRGKLVTVSTYIIRKNSLELGREKANANGVKYNGEAESGLTLGRSPLNNDIASDVTEAYLNGTISSDGYLALTWHEFGNALAAQNYLDDYTNARTQADRDKLNSPFLGSKPTAQGDTDAGVAFERCLYGGIVGLRSGRIGNSREF